MTKSQLPSGPKEKVPFGHMFAARRDVIGFLTRIAKEYGDIAYFKIGPLAFALLNHPDLIKQVLEVNHRNFVKGRPLELAKRLLGEGLLTSEMEFHEQQWRLIQPAFHRKRIKAYGKLMAEYAVRWSECWKDGTTLDMAKEMTQLSTAIAGKTMFNTDVEQEAPEINEALATAASLFTRVTVPFSEWLLKLPLPSTFRFYKAKARLDKTIYQMIDARRRSGKDFGDILSLLLNSQAENGRAGTMTDQQVRDETLTLFLTAFDTTSLALTWTWYLLSQHPEVEAEMHTELDKVLGGRAPTVDDLPQLQKTRMVLAESIRLCPPLYVIARKALNDFSVGNYIIPAGTLVLMSPYLIHHDSRFFPEPEAFNPHRWGNDSNGGRPRYAYFPFGGGPRGCIGEPFAWMEGVLVLATLAQTWKMRLLPCHPVAFLPLVNLRPKYGMVMTVQRR